LLLCYRCSCSKDVLYSYRVSQQSKGLKAKSRLDQQADREKKHDLVDGEEIDPARCTGSQAQSRIAR